MGGNVAVRSINALETFHYGQKTVTTAGTEVVLASTQVLLSGVTIKAKSTNTGLIFVGGDPVTSSTGFVLSANESVFIEINNLASIYIDSSVSGEGVSFIAS